MRNSRRRRLRALLAGVLLLVFSGGFMAETAEAQNRREILETPRYYLLGSVALGYTQYWGDGGNRSAFSQSYRVGGGGRILDPRIATWGLQLGAGSSGKGDTPWSYSATFNLHLLNDVSELKRPVYRWLPKPVDVSVSYNGGDDYTVTTYSLSMFYTRPYRIWFFTPDGKTTQLLPFGAKPKGYREKSSESQWAIEDAGNGDGNSDGWGNGNGNGNGWGNGNGNGNGNGWGNGNGNGNGNGRGNGNGNGNGNG